MFPYLDELGRIVRVSASVSSLDVSDLSANSRTDRYCEFHATKMKRNRG